MSKVKKTKKTTINCKDGLDKKQELLARKIKNELLEPNGKENAQEEINNLYKEYKEMEFELFLRYRNPSLYSALKRVGWLEDMVTNINEIK